MVVPSHQRLSCALGLGLLLLGVVTSSTPIQSKPHLRPNTTELSHLPRSPRISRIALPYPTKPPSPPIDPPPFSERDCTGQHIFHSPFPGEAAANKQKWVDMGLSATDLAMILNEE